MFLVCHDTAFLFSTRAMTTLADFRHHNHVTFTPIAKNFMLYCRLIYMLSILCVRLTIKVKVGIPESFKVGWYPPQKTGSSHLNLPYMKYLPEPTQRAIQSRFQVSVALRSSRPKVISPEVMSPETRVMSPEIYSDVARNFIMLKKIIKLLVRVKRETMKLRLFVSLSFSWR